MSVSPDQYAYVNPAPFDDDSADYVLPIAKQFTDHLDIPHFEPNLTQQSIIQTPTHAVTIPCTEARLARFWKWMRGRFGLGDG